MAKQIKQAGFTLVELAIVLVIIGLIIGGVLVGQDLIRAAELRTVITDLDRFNSSATTFRNKYNGYPGDLEDSRATNFGLESTGTDGTDGRGDGDGILEHGTVAANKTGAGGENVLFWRHLSEAQLLAEGFNTVTGGLAVAAAANANVADVLPITRLRDSADFHIYGWGGRNYFYIAGVTAIAATTGLMTEGDALTPQESENIDGKMDDAQPLTGVVRARQSVDDAADLTDANAAEPPAAPAGGICVSNAVAAPDSPYNLNEDFAGVQACRLRFRASF